MTTYKVGYFVGSLSSKSINRLLSRALVRLAPPELPLTEIPFKDLPLYKPRLRGRLPSGGEGAEGGDRIGRCGAVRHPGVQPLDPGGVEERH